MDITGVGIRYELPPASDPTNHSYQSMLPGQLAPIVGAPNIRAPQHSGISPGPTQGYPTSSSIYSVPLQYVNYAGVPHHVSFFFIYFPTYDLLIAIISYHI